MPKRRLSEWLGSIAVLSPFAAAIIYLHYWRGAAYDAFVFGSGSWGIGCLLKLALYHGVIRRLRHDTNSILAVSALNGLVSGLTELGAALAIFAFLPAMSLWDLLAFGVGIGTIEAFLVSTSSTSELLKGTQLEKAAEDLEVMIAGSAAPLRFWYRYLFPFMERLIAATIHIGTRGLVYVAHDRVDPVPFLVALTAFVLADGMIGYRLLVRGRLKAPSALAGAYLALGTVAVVVMAVFLAYWPVSVVP